MMKKIIISFLSVLIAFASVSFAGCTGNNKIKLYFDGGGGSGNYNSTISMTPGVANPYPYNRLELLAKEWNKNNDTYEIVINSNSLNGRRDAVTSMLRAGTAPDMLYQAGGVINDDIGENWYVKLTDYLEKPNPYVEGNERWRDLYNYQELTTTKAADDNYYYVCLDKVPVGVMYNTEILSAAGITKIPETYSEFLACLETLSKAKSDGKITAETYIHQGLWNEIYLNTSVYGSKISEWDLDGNRMVSSYELTKTYKEGKWDIDGAEFREYLKLLYDKAKYYPDNYLAYDTAVNFSRGRLAVTDGLGNNMRIAAKALGDKLAIRGFPRLDADASAFGGFTGVRGSAGLSTAYWVTNSAINKGEGAVEACIDFLMYLTAPENNAKMVNDLGFALPINAADNTTSLFDDLVKEYEKDTAEEGSLMWSAVNICGSFGQEFSDTYERNMGEYYQGKTDANGIISLLKSNLPAAVEKLISKHKWDL